MTISIKGKLLDITQPIVMGIVNHTADSFYSGNRCKELDSVLKMAEKHVSAGADWLDVGCVSTRPGAKEIEVATEKELAIEAVAAIRKEFPQIPISIDTWRAEVALAAAEAGADMVNDISGGEFDSEMFATVAQLGTPYLLTHTSGKPSVMQKNVQYNNVITDLFRFFGEKIEKLTDLGVHDVIIDPGFGFGKTIEQNYLLLKNLSYFKKLNCPILVGLSRKSMIYKPLGQNPEDALNGTTVLNTMALQNGANILRVHDVKEAKEVVKLFFLLNTPDESTNTL
ncbi:MAG: dihydropteroate synthase [Bacteroidales bacterium]|nr:dihydropteroate synthase [Bacteroidales bacterium]